MSPGDHEGEISLLGGVREGGTLVKNAHLRDMTGVLEQRLHETARQKSSLPRKVSAFIEVAVESVAGRCMDAWLPGELCIADRRFLMLQLARQLAGDIFWVHTVCTGCSERFDVEVSRSKLSTKTAGSTFPFVDVSIRGTSIRIRVPNGSDQEQVADMDVDAARAELLRRCITTVAGKPPSRDFVESLTRRAISTMEAALDEVAPDVGTVMEVVCPECAEPQLVEFDPYQSGVFGNQDIFDEVHTLASIYHWSEADILSLPRKRRQTYLGLIERSRGAYS